MNRESLFARPASCPAIGQIGAFDAGWNAHEVGLSREMVKALAGIAEDDEQARQWALMAWDVRQKLTETA